MLVNEETFKIYYVFVMVDTMGSWYNCVAMLFVAMGLSLLNT